MSAAKERWVETIRAEIQRARQALEGERDRLLAEKSSLEQQIASLDQEMGVLQRMGAQPEHDGRDDGVTSGGKPLSQRVLDTLRLESGELTSREMRERLRLDHRETRNLGPVLNQLMRSGKVENDGRGTPWRLIR